MTKNNIDTVFAGYPIQEVAGHPGIFHISIQGAIPEPIRLAAQAAKLYEVFEHGHDSRFSSLWKNKEPDPDRVGVDFFVAMERGQMLGIALWERYAEKIEWVPNTQMDRRMKPTFEFPVRHFGRIGFFVYPENRNQGVGGRLADCFIAMVMAEHDKESSLSLALPFITAKGRAVDLIKANSAIPVVYTPNKCMGRDGDLFRAFLRAADKHLAWYPGCRKLERKPNIKISVEDECSIS